MRRRVVIVPLLLLAGVLLVRRRRRMRAAPPPLAAPQQDAPVALLEPAPRFLSVPWTLVEASDSHLEIAYVGDEHMELDRIDVQETPTQVFVTVLMCVRTPAGGWFADRREQSAVVALSGPLGERALVHTPVDADALSQPAGGGGGPSVPPLYP